MTAAQIEARAGLYGYGGLVLLVVAACICTFPVAVCLAMATAAFVGVLVGLWRRCQPAAVLLGVAALFAVSGTVGWTIGGEAHRERWDGPINEETSDGG